MLTSTSQVLSTDIFIKLKSVAHHLIFRTNHISASNLIKDQISSLSCDSSGERLFAKSAEDNNIYIFNAQDFQKKPKILKSKSKGGSAVSSADNSILAVAGENILEIL